MKTLAVTVFLSFLVLSWFSACAHGHTDVTPEMARNKIDSNERLIVVDVREYQNEYCDVGHIPGAVNYPWNSGVLEQRYTELPAHGEILVVCRSGGRSHQASTFLDSKGFLHIFDMQGGMNAWQWETVGCVDSDGDGVNDDLDDCPEVFSYSQPAVAPRVLLCDLPCVNLDGLNPVNMVDFSIFARHWGLGGVQLAGDFNTDEIVDERDLALIAEYWFSDCFE